MISLGQQVATGAVWMILVRVADRLVGIISISVLARLLLPEHFGVVALGASLVGLLEAMSEFGVDLALIRDQRSDPRLYDTAWTIRILRAAALGVVLVLAARPAAMFFSEPRLEAILACLALAGILNAAENIGVVEFRTSLAFDKEFKYLVLARCLSAPVAITTALLWPSHWALVAGVLAQQLLRLVLSYRVHSYRPRLSLAGAGALMGFSTWIALQNLVHTLNTRAPAFVLGRLSHVTAVAHFDVAYEMAMMATSDLRAPIRRALFPGFARLAGDTRKLAQGYIDSYGVMVLVGLPIPVLIGVMAPLLVHVFLGEQWRPAVPVVEVLAVYGVIQALSPSSYLVYVALDKVRLTTMLSTLHLALLVPLLILAVREAGAVGAAWALSVTAALIVLADGLIVTRVLGIRVLNLGAAAARPVLAAAGMFLMLRALSPVPSSATLRWELMRLAVVAVGGASLYAALVLGLWSVLRRPEGAEWRAVMLLTQVRDRLYARSARGKPPRTGPLVHARSSRRAMIVFGCNEWDGIWQTRQHITSRLAQRGWRTAYSTGQLFTYERANPEWKSRSLFTRRQIRDDVTIVRSGRMLARYPRLPWWDRWALRRHARDLMAAVGWSEASHRIAYVYHPTFWPYLAFLAECHVVYHADDAFGLLPEATAEGQAMETRLVDRADLVLASSEAMARLLPSGGPEKARLLPNAADVGPFMTAERQACPPDLQVIPGPRIGYTGSINPKVDLALVAEVASRRPEWSWVLVGPVRETAAPRHPGSRGYAEALAACRSLRNVHFLGPKMMGEIPAYVAHMHVNTMCYRTDPGGWWIALYPLKLHEYLAVGRPIVASNLEALRPFRSVLSIAETVDDWVLAIEGALAADDPAMKDARRSVAMANTWDHRLDQLVRWLP